MAAELKGKTAATKEARKALLRQIHKAQTPLQSKHVADSGVHAARKQIKMARARLPWAARAPPTMTAIPSGALSRKR
jgi:hypothetical protein